MNKLLLVGLFAAGCSFNPNPASGGGDDTPGSGDAAVPGDDAGDDAPKGHDAGPATCLNAWMSGNVTITDVKSVGAVNTSTTERDPFLSQDELTLFFSQFIDDGIGGGDTDIMVSTRASIADPFEDADFLPGGTGGVDNFFNQSKFSMTGDGLYAVYSADDLGDPDVLVTTRASTAVSFPKGTATAALKIDTAKNEFDPAITLDGKELYYAPVPANHQVISHSLLQSDNTWGAGATLVDDGTGDADPAISTDELILLYTSHLSGSGDLYYITRTSKDVEFLEADAKPVGGMVNDANSADGDPWLSADGCRLYFASQRVADNDFDLFVATVQPVSL